MPFINTRDSYSTDQECLDDFISGNMEELKESELSTVYTNKFASNKWLKRIEFPNVTKIENTAFADSVIETIKIGGSTCNMGYGSLFYKCGFLKHVVFENITSVPGTTTYTLNGSPFAFGEGYIYVPSTLVSNFKTATRWSSIASQIHPLSEYPIPIYTVSDTWAQIIANAANGTHSTVYNKGDTKELIFNNKSYTMVYAGDRPEGPVWVTKYLVGKGQKFNATTNNKSGNYSDSDIDAYLSLTMFNALPGELQSAIAEVPITCYDGYANTTRTFDRKIWLLSTKELGFTETDCKEDSGYVFDIFNSADSRKRFSEEDCARNSYWLRSTNDKSKAYAVNAQGPLVTMSVGSNNICIIFGFVLSGPST